MLQLNSFYDQNVLKLIQNIFPVLTPNLISVIHVLYILKCLFPKTKISGTCITNETRMNKDK